MVLNFTIVNTEPNFPILFWRKNIGPLEVKNIRNAIRKNNGRSKINARKENIISIVDLSLMQVIPFPSSELTASKIIQ
jgi:hypothetical protein